MQKRNFDKSDEKLIEIAKQFEAKNKIKIKKIGGGFYGIVLNIELENMVAKLIKKEKNDETSHISDIIGPNIIKINKIYTEHIIINKKDEWKYHLIIMEKADLKDLKTILIDTYNKILNLTIATPFEGLLSDNLIKYYCYEIIKGFETLDRSGYSHFEIKPENILIIKAN